MRVRIFNIFLLILLSVFFVSCKSEPLITMVSIPGKNYSIGQTEITQNQYSKIMKANPSKFKGKEKPVTNISWFDCICFCNKLSIRENLTPVYSVNGETNPEEIGWYKLNTDSPQNVATKQCNAYGLYDMSGNVFEWTSDVFLNKFRCFCGGSWDQITMYMRIDRKSFNAVPVYYGPDMGFRVIRYN